MSGGGGTRTEIQQVPGPPAGGVVPQLQPFVGRVGQLATAALGLPELDLQRFATDQTQQIPGLSPLEQNAAMQIGQRAQNTGAPYGSAARFLFPNMGFDPSMLQGLNMTPPGMGMGGTPVGQWIPGGR